MNITETFKELQTSSIYKMMVCFQICAIVENTSVWVPDTKFFEMDDIRHQKSKAYFQVPVIIQGGANQLATQINLLVSKRRNFGV